MTPFLNGTLPRPQAEDQDAKSRPSEERIAEGRVSTQYTFPESPAEFQGDEGDDASSVHSEGLGTAKRVRISTCPLPASVKCLSGYVLGFHCSVFNGHEV